MQNPVTEGLAELSNYLQIPRQAINFGRLANQKTRNQVIC